MISHKHRCIFVHIPKNAGQSIENVFLADHGLTWETRAPLLLRANDQPSLGPPALGHLMARQYVPCQYVTPRMFADYFKFSFVRNPWDRLVSIYKHFNYDTWCTFRQFALEKFEKEIWRTHAWFVGPQIDFLTDDAGNVIVDYIGRFETLQDDFNIVAARVGIGAAALPHVNKAKHRVGVRFTLHPKRWIKMAAFHLRRPPQFPHARDYHDADTIALVERLYARDIERLGYQFGSPEATNLREGRLVGG